MRVERTFMYAAQLIVVTMLSVSPAYASDAEQLVLVVTANWDANQGVMHTFERTGDRWQALSNGVPVAIGRAGAAWGIGLHEPQAGAQKREGDGRSPAGMFGIGTAFGYALHERTGLSYQAMNENDYCIDVNESPHYNRIVDARTVGRTAVEKSTEPMRRDIHANGDRRYALGFVIEHNPKRGAAQGSCIFAHVWGSPGQTTAGCTAMTEDAMRELVAWLDAKRRPLFVLLPYAEYLRVRATWNLPMEVLAPK